MDLTSRQTFLSNNLKLEIPIIKKISELGRISGTKNKYDIWIGKEYKKQLKNNNLDILEDSNKIYYILDWVKNTHPDLYPLTFEQANELAIGWHKIFENSSIINKKEEDFSNTRIIYKCKNNINYFILLKPDDLELEGQLMKSCVGTYKSKVKSGISLIVSLRDDKNEPHVTIEIDIKTGRVVQIKGKANAEPKSEYLKLVTEFALYASGYGEEIDEELLELMNSKFE